MTGVIDGPTRQRLDWMVSELCSEFAGQFDRDQIAEVMEDSADRLVASATVMDYVPLIAYRFARERLSALDRARGEDSEGSWDVVFVSLSGGGRGQLAAALTSLLSESRVSVHSAGTAVHGQIDPGVSAVIGELGVDRDDAFAKPVTDEVLRGADVVVTMGHSVGVFELPSGATRQDWRVGDPVGAPIDEVRRVRADIEHRVRALLAQLGVPVSDERAVGAS